MTASASAEGTLRLVADYVVAGEGTGAVIAGGAIDIGDAGRITAVGKQSTLGPALGEVRHVGGLLMPGLVNGHAHGPMTLLRSAGDGLPLMQWLTDAVWPREAKMTPDDAYTGMALASCEMLLAGVTSSVEMYLFEHDVARAIAATGARGHVMAGVISAIAPDDDAFANRLDAIGSFVALHGADSAATTLVADGRISAGFGPHSVWDLGPERLRLVGQAARAAGAIVHVHLEETEGERQQILDSFGHTATQLLAEAGVLENKVVAAHGVWLDDADLALLAQADAGLVHCPQSNLKLGSGIARVGEWRKAGIATAIGTDGAASNDNLSLWDELTLAPMLARGTAHDPGAMSAADAFFLATKGGAAAVGIDDVGELRPGAWADIVRLELDHPAFAPNLEADLFNNLVWSAGAQHVTDVWVGGNRVVAERQLTTLDQGELLASAGRAGQRLA